MSEPSGYAGTATLDRHPMFPLESRESSSTRPRTDDERTRCSIADAVLPARGQE
ncbi:MAG TPA: hypothetical protein VNS55_06235 [Nocardioides sp.]|nr:hypothetical protein [Nocardioides sp.]